MAMQCWHSQENTYAHLLSRSDLDGAWVRLAPAAGKFLAARQGSVDGLRPGGISCGFLKQAFAPQVGRQGEALTAALAAQQRVIRQAEGALLLWPPRPGGGAPWLILDVAGGSSCGYFGPRVPFGARGGAAGPQGCLF